MLSIERQNDMKKFIKVSYDFLFIVAILLRITTADGS